MFTCITFKSNWTKDVEMWHFFLIDCSSGKPNGVYCTKSISLYWVWWLQNWWVWLVASLHCLKLKAFLSVVNSNDNSHIVHIPWEAEWGIGNALTKIGMQHFKGVLNLWISNALAWRYFLSTCHLVRSHFGAWIKALSIYNGVYLILVGILLSHLFTINILSIVGIGKPIIAIPLLC